MPNLAHRRELDSRAERFESEVRSQEAAGKALWAGRRKLPYCNRCQRAYEEKSKVCPRCDKKDQMGYLAPIPERHVEEAQRNAIRRAQSKVRK